MRGNVDPQADMFCLLSPESRVPKDHPLRRVKLLVDEVLRDLSPFFEEMYAEDGRPSIPPERLLKAKMLPGSLYHSLGKAAHRSAGI